MDKDGGELKDTAVEVPVASETSMMTSETAKKPKTPSPARTVGQVVVCVVAFVLGYVVSKFAFELPWALPVIIYGIQYLGWAYGFWRQTEMYYDLTGSATYFIATLYTLLVGTRSPRSIWASVCVLVWCTRLGTYLFTRILRDGKDGRFDDLKPFPFAFLVAWSLQGLWVTLVASPVYVVNLWSSAYSTLNARDYVGFVLWTIGFAVEVLSDWQKDQFRKDPANRGKFIQGGMWSWSRHPNYFGEILLWVGLFIACSNSFEGAQWLTILGPLFTAFLLCFVSGIPMLEKRADERWGNDPEYQKYKKATSVLVLWPPGCCP
eukprot:comp12189_c0_seq1/m.6952 comp12189_c0_seq1/g.6952  ORF comp12189_c0_seq1/g.6952 comp12189_c0_seq1/m.6952 type:complete len:320 (-) comp12189_c0_seq1:61-1020(-)